MQSRMSRKRSVTSSSQESVQNSYQKKKVFRIVPFGRQFLLQFTIWKTVLVAHTTVTMSFVSNACFSPGRLEFGKTLASRRHIFV